MGNSQCGSATGLDVSAIAFACIKTYHNVQCTYVVVEYRYFDDGTKARKKPPRHYAFRKSVKPIVAENRWATFLNHWSSADLACATNLVCAHVSADLSADEHELLYTLKAIS